MIAKTETKIKYIVTNWINGNKKEAAKKVRGLTKIELFYLVSSHNILVCRELIGNKEKQCSLENFVCNALEGVYS